jgi:ABC-type phosphate transport system substrate-binding protein
MYVHQVSLKTLGEIVFAKKIVAVGLALIVTLGLAACDPPMPPEILAAEAEKVVRCVDGELTVATPTAVADVIDSWSSSVSGACSGMSLTKLDGADITAQAVISMGGAIAAECKPFATFPIAIDGGVVAYALSDAPNLNLSPANIQDIFSGKIKNWADPSLAANNPDAVLPNLPIRVVGSPETSVINSLTAWFKKLSVAFTPTLAKVSPVDDGAFLAALAEGDIALTSYSNALYNYSTVAAITLEGGSAIADAQGLQNGADENYAPGEGDAPAYAATYPVTIALCGADNEIARTVTRYLVRQDAQGALGAAVVAPLPDSLRISTIALIEKGLPKTSK